MNEYNVSDYGIFNDAISTIKNLSSAIDTAKTSIDSYKEQLGSESIFMGPIADSCKEVFTNVNSKIATMTENFSTIGSYLAETATNYQNSDQTASNLLSGIPADFSNLSITPSSKKDIDLTNIPEGSRVATAVSKYASELENAEYATVSPNLFTTTTTKKINGQPVKVTHVVINNPNQINGAPANGGYKKGLEKSSSAAKRLNAEILVNGSHFKYSNGAEDLQCHNNIAIVNGEVKAPGKSGGHELLIDKNGNIYNANGKSAQKLLNNGVKYSFSCHSTQVLVNGSIEPSYKEKHLYKRTVIGQNAPCEYYIITDTNYNNKLSNTAKYLKSLGCKNAYSLDQGGSVSLVRKGQLINNPSDKNGERAVGDFLYFTS